MADSTRYVEELRAIGQMLTGRNIVDFELKHVDSGYLIFMSTRLRSARAFKIGFMERLMALALNP